MISSVPKKFLRTEPQGCRLAGHHEPRPKRFGCQQGILTGVAELPRQSCFGIYSYNDIASSGLASGQRFSKPFLHAPVLPSRRGLSCCRHVGSVCSLLLLFER